MPPCNTLSCEVLLQRALGRRDGICLANTCLGSLVLLWPPVPRLCLQRYLEQVGESWQAQECWGSTLRSLQP